MSAFVITGTDTGIGKTVFAAGLVAALDGVYWKPVQAGLDEESDSETVQRLSGLPADRILPEIYRFATPCSPHRAAEIERTQINADALHVPTHTRPLIIEGAGGVLVPLTHSCLYADIFALWALPVVVVARTALGTINHSLLTIEALRRRGVAIAGVAFVGAAHEDSETTIAHIGKVKRLGRLPYLSTLDQHTLAAAFSSHFNVKDFCS